MGKFTTGRIQLCAWLHICLYQSMMVDSSAPESVTFTVALYRDKAYNEYFSKNDDLSEEESLKIHSSGIQYFFSDPDLQHNPRLKVQFIVRKTLFSFEEYGISFDSFLQIFSDFQNEELKTSDEKWDHALLLTGNMSKPEGMTTVGGFCNTKNSSSIIKAHSLHLVPFLATRYIIRNMGMEWDSLDGYIMSRNISSRTSSKWSDRSKNFMKNLLSKKNNCLREGDLDFNLLSYLPGLRVNLDQQCKVAHGKDFHFPSNESKPSSACQNLICIHSNIEKTLGVPSLPGSNCGRLEYCWRGNCQPVFRILKEINGGILGTTTGPLGNTSIIGTMFKCFLKVIRLVNFIYNRI